MVKELIGKRQTYPKNSMPKYLISSIKINILSSDNMTRSSIVKQLLVIGQRLDSSLLTNYKTVLPMNILKGLGDSVREARRSYMEIC
jgi:hypothetical protein